MKLHCPNCGKQYDLNADQAISAGQPVGCGDCAQAGVRPRTLYALVEDAPVSPVTGVTDVTQGDTGDTESRVTGVTRVTDAENP